MNVQVAYDLVVSLPGSTLWVGLASPADEFHSPGVQLVKIVGGIRHFVRCVTWGSRDIV